MCKRAHLEPLDQLCLSVGVGQRACWTPSPDLGRALGVKRLDKGWWRCNILQNGGSGCVAHARTLWFKAIRKKREHRGRKQTTGGISHCGFAPKKVHRKHTAHIQ